MDDVNYRLDEQVGFLLRRAHQRHTALFAELMPKQLTPPQFSALARLYERPALPDFLARRVHAAGAQGLVFGLSGGIDSAVVGRLCQLAMPESSLGLLMPCHSNRDDEADARLVAEHFGIPVMRVPLASCESTAKYGFVRAKSCRLRLTVGSASISSVETADDAPVRFGLMIGSTVAVTVMASLTVASCVGGSVAGEGGAPQPATSSVSRTPTPRKRRSGFGTGVMRRRVMAIA